MDYRIREAIELIDKEIRRLEDAKAVLQLIGDGGIIQGAVSANGNKSPSGQKQKSKPTVNNRAGKRHNLSKEARASIAAAQKKRWDAFHAAKAKAAAKQEKAAQ